MTDAPTYRLRPEIKPDIADIDSRLAQTYRDLRHALRSIKSDFEIVSETIPAVDLEARLSTGRDGVAYVEINDNDFEYQHIQIPIAALAYPYDDPDNWHGHEADQETLDQGRTDRATIAQALRDLADKLDAGPPEAPRGKFTPGRRR